MNVLLHLLSAASLDMQSWLVMHMAKCFFPIMICILRSTVYTRGLHSFGIVECLGSCTFVVSVLKVPSCHFVHSIIFFILILMSYWYIVVESSLLC